MMKKITALILSAAIAPAFVLSSSAFAESHDNTEIDAEHPAKEQQAGMESANKDNADRQRAGKPQFDVKPSGAIYATDIIGNNIKHRNSDEDVGEVQDLLIGKDGSVVGVVVETSGFLGLGGQSAGLGWDYIEYGMEEDELMLYTDIEEEALRNSPKYERD